MSQKQLTLSEFRGMWLFAMFDLPVDSKEARRAYVQFRNALIRDGFTMIQFSVYARYCENEESSTVHRKRIRKALPEDGHVRVISITDHQFGKMEVYRGKKRRRPEDEPQQLMLF